MAAVCEYEAIRHKNVEERKALLSTILKELRDYCEPIRRSLTAPSRPRTSAPRQRYSYSSVVPNTRIRRSRRLRWRSNQDEDKDYVYNSEGDDTESEEEDKVLDPKKRIIVCFPCQAKFRRVETNTDFVSIWDQESSDEDEELLHLPRERRVVRRTADEPVVLPPEEITEKDLRNVAQKSGGKTYSSEHGTCCHQCRQKTLDMKTMCRSGHCVGVRGQFCGPCLKNRYGESAEKALKDPNWSCPPCRGLCNCSICRTREGKRPTGILVPLVKSEGYRSVKEYLEFQDD